MPTPNTGGSNCDLGPFRQFRGTRAYHARIRGDDAGSVMLQIIRRNPEAVKDDFYEYVKSRPFKVSKLILSGFSNPANIDELKEAYLSYVNNYAENVGHYPIAHTTLSIMGVRE